MAQWLNPPIALVEDLCSTPNPYMVESELSETSRESNTLF